MIDFLYYYFYRLVALIIRIIFYLNGGLDVKGREHVPSEGGAIIAPNHISYLDPPIIGAVLPRNVTFMARRGLFKVPVLKWLICRAAFPVDRDKPRPSSIKEAVRRLKNRELLVMFPEGRRNETGELGEAKRGISMIAGLSRAPIVPALIIGTEKALPVGARWLKRAKITVVFGKPIHYTFTKAKKDHPGNGLQSDPGNTIMSAIRKLKEEYGNNCC